MAKRARKQTAIRFTSEECELIERLQETLGEKVGGNVLSVAAVIRLGLMALAEKHGVAIPKGAKR